VIILIFAVYNHESIAVMLVCKLASFSFNICVMYENSIVCDT